MTNPGRSNPDKAAATRERAALGGARSGRGFRYQDACAAALAIVGFVERTSWTVSPEANEDITILHGASQVIEVQAKSRRDRKADLTAADVIRELVDLWERHIDRFANEDVRVCLIIDRAPTGCSPTGLSGSLADNPTLGAAALSAVGARVGRSASDLQARTHILLAEAPAVFATDLLATHLGVLHIAAEVLFRQVLAQIGLLVDHRAAGKGPGSLTPNQVARIVEEGQRVLDVTSIEAPLRSGICEFIDFETPVHDPAFYLGVDVVAGHIAAGLVAERPEAVAECLETIDRTGTAIVTGPSGVGKSAVAYLAARSTRHLVRWIRVRDGSGSAFDLIKLTEALRASRHAPVGLLVDDIGRIGARMWDSLVQEARSHDGVIVLGTTREEDLDILMEAAESLVVRPKLDEELAHAIWEQLSAEGATTTTGWLEALDQSDGLTLEFVHFLTTGVRLPETVARQVGQRRKEHRDHELQLLRVTSVAAISGAAIDLRRFAGEFLLSDEDVQRALTRLMDEHLVRAIGQNEVTGLHRLRSEALLRATHDTPPPSLEETAAAAIRCTTPTDLPELAAELVDRGLLTRSGIYNALNRRLDAEPTSTTLAGCLTGLRLASLREYSHAVRSILDQNDVPLALRHIAVGMAMVEDRGVSNLFDPRITAALPEVRAISLTDMRTAWLEQAPAELLAKATLSKTTEAGTALLLALAGTPQTADLAFDVIRLMPTPNDIQSTAQFLDAARLVDNEVSSAAMTAVGGVDHLLELARRQPWVARLELRDEPMAPGTSELVLEFQLLCVEEGFENDPHTAVVDLCRLYLSLFPDVDVVSGKAVDSSGQLLGFRGYNVADKRIPRSNLPSASEIRWNRELLNCFADAGNESKTDRLATEATLLSRTRAITTSVADRWLARRGPSTTHTIELQAIAAEAGNVWKRERKPSDPTQKNGSQPDIGDIASALKLLCGNALPRLFTSADMALAAFLGDTIRPHLLKTVGVGYWRLLGINLDDEVLDLVATIDQLHSLIGLRLSEEAGAEITWDARIPRQTLAQSARAADVAHDTHLERTMRNVAREIRSLGFVAEVDRVAAQTRQALIWPSDDVVITIHVRALFSWLGAAPILVGIAKREFGTTRSVVVVPQRQGHIVPMMALRTLATSDGIAFPAAEQAEELATQRGLPTITADVGPAIMRCLSLQAAADGIAQIESQRALCDEETEALSRIQQLLASVLDVVEPVLQTDTTGVIGDLLRTFFERVGESSVSETLSAISQGNADELLGVIGLLHVAEIENRWDPENVHQGFESLPNDTDDVNPTIASHPGIPTDCFDHIEQIDGLMAELDVCRSLTDLNDALDKAVEAGALSGVVANHVRTWNDLKARSTTFVDDYTQFCLLDSRRWAEAGLPHSANPGTAQPTTTKTGRNQPCPCGSGRKRKFCHG